MLWNFVTPFHDCKVKSMKQVVSLCFQHCFFVHLKNSPIYICCDLSVHYLFYSRWMHACVSMYYMYMWKFMFLWLSTSHPSINYLCMYDLSIVYPFIICLSVYPSIHPSVHPSPMYLSSIYPSPAFLGSSFCSSYLMIIVCSSHSTTWKMSPQREGHHLVYFHSVRDHSPLQVVAQHLIIVAS